MKGCSLAYSVKNRHSQPWLHITIIQGFLSFSTSDLRERKRDTDFCCATYLCVHCDNLVCVLMRVGTHNLDGSERCWNQLSYSYRAFLKISMPGPHHRPTKFRISGWWWAAVIGNKFHSCFWDVARVGNTDTDEGLRLKIKTEEWNYVIDLAFIYSLPFASGKKKNQLRFCWEEKYLQNLLTSDAVSSSNQDHQLY